MQNETRKPPSSLISEETGTIHLPSSPTLFKLYNLQLHLHCAILPKMHMIFFQGRRRCSGHPPASSAQVPWIPPLGSSLVLRFPAGDPLTELYPASKLPCQLTGSQQLLKSIPLPTLHVTGCPFSSAAHLLLSLPTPSQPHVFPAPGVAFKIKYVFGWPVFWEVAGSPSCDSCQ